MYSYYKAPVFVFSLVFKDCFYLIKTVRQQERNPTVLSRGQSVSFQRLTSPITRMVGQPPILPLQEGELEHLEMHPQKMD